MHDGLAGSLAVVDADVVPIWMTLAVERGARIDHCRNQSHLLIRGRFAYRWDVPAANDQRVPGRGRMGITQRVSALSATTRSAAMAQNGQSSLMSLDRPPSTTN
jgi:hypothetical protein